ncbi:MAG: hypothetical protein ACJ0BN_12645 [Limisphaerales bacterium]|tara:strand:+ start:329 stop:460 length:132 start_codon:yes stop_codon:yes gene_type:complete
MLDVQSISLGNAAVGIEDHEILKCIDKSESRIQINLKKVGKPT